MSSFVRLIPFLVIIIGLLALYQLYNGLMFAIGGQFPFALFYAVFGFAGFVLAWSLWSNRQKFAPRQR